MKKTLLTLCLGFGLVLNAQVFVDESVNSLTVGNVGTDLTGVTPGQGDWLTIVTAGGANTDFQVINNGDIRGNMFQITGSNTMTNNRRLVKDASGDWGFRDAGNDVAEVEFDFFTGPETTTANNMRVLLYDATLTKMLGGIMVYMSTLELRGLGYYDATAQAGGVLGNYSFRLAYTATPTPAYSDVILQRNTWYRLGFSYNYATGQLIFKEGTGLITAPPVQGAATGTEVSLLNIAMNAVSTSATQPNNVSGIGWFDNILFKASAANSPLAVAAFAPSENQFAVYPNPASQIINIANENTKITAIVITDLNGRIVKQASFDNVSKAEMNIAELSSGVYMMSIKSAEGEVNKKFVKR
jgi:hypothetical protein